MRKAIRKMYSVLLCTVVACGLCGCILSNAAIEEKPLKIAVYVGDGARGIGAYRWLELASSATNAVAIPVDGAAVRSGALEGMDLVIMPGGKGSIEGRTLGPEGRKKLVSFIKGGGGYVGTCAGFYLLMQPGKGVRKDYLGLIPYSDSAVGSSGRGELLLKFNEKATELAGIKKGYRKVWYVHGPVPDSVDVDIEDASSEVVATYVGNVNTTSKPRESYAGHPAAVAARYGKGRIFAFTVHPECDVADHDLVEGAIRYATGRDIKFDLPQRKAGQLAVGVMVDDSLGVDTAKFLQETMRKGEFDLVPVSAREISEGELHHLDAILAPANDGQVESKGGLYGDNLERAREFVSRGALVVAWGNAAERAKRYGLDAKIVQGSNEALEALRAFGAGPVADTGARPGKVKNSVRAAVFAGRGCSMSAVPPILALSPEYKVDVVGADDIAKGRLAKYDMLLVPGGYSSLVWKTLGEEGRKGIVDYVRGGGKYYGICGGAFLASQTEFTHTVVAGKEKRKERVKHLGLIPFKDDQPHPYRGWAPTRIRMTGEGKNVFSSKSDVRRVMYWGGPAFIEARAVEDSDIKVLAKYEGWSINTSSSQSCPEMFGKAAIVGGRVGKGRVFVQSPHPEKHECTFDIVRDALKFLTGVRPTGKAHDRVRGAKSVIVQHMSDGHTMKEAVKFLLSHLTGNARYDVRVVNSENDSNFLPHADIVLVCVFDEYSWTPARRRFVEKGGRVIFVADTEGKRRISSKFKGAEVVESYEAAVKELEK